jgi:alcohol dehydrogenase
VIEFNAVASEEVADQFRGAAELLGVDAAGDGESIGRALADHVRELRSRLGLSGRLSEVGVPEEAIPQLAEDAMGEGSTLVNPREPSEEDFVALFEQAL